MDITRSKAWINLVKEVRKSPPTRSGRLLIDLAQSSATAYTVPWLRIFDDICIPAAMEGKTVVKLPYNIGVDVAANLHQVGVSATIFHAPECICVGNICEGCKPVGKTVLTWRS